MITTIDRAGRIVVPKALREAAGLVSAVEITLEGSRITIAAPPLAPVRDERGRLRLPATGERVTVDDVRDERLNVQR